MKRAVIFDLDGTLLNTSEDIQKALNASLKKFSLPVLSLEKTIEFVGNGAKNLVIKAVGDRQDYTGKVYEDFLVNYKTTDNNLTKYYPGEEETLAKLKSRGLAMAILTNKPQAATEQVYGKFLAKFGFNIVLGQTEYLPLKPNPASTLYILDKLGVKKEDCLFVGDGEADVYTAAAAGVEHAAALWGYRTKSRLEEAGAKIFLKQFSDIEKFI